MKHYMVILCVFLTVCSSINAFSPEKVKVINFSSAIGRRPEDFKRNQKFIESLPIDGTVYDMSRRPDGKSFISDWFMSPEWKIKYEHLKLEVDTLRSIKWNKPFQLFARINLSARLDSDWFDDNAWQQMLSNIKVAAKAARAGGATGIFLDNEQYHLKPFCFNMQKHRLEKSFDEYRLVVRKRGKQFMETLISEFPNPVILVAYSNSILFQSNLKVNSLGLWPAFLDGMLAAKGKAQIYDAFERAYTYRKFSRFKEARTWIKKDGAKISFDPSVYRKNIKAAYGIWIRGPKNKKFAMQKNYAENAYTPEELKHALYYAKSLSDGYVWLYGCRWRELPVDYTAAIKDSNGPLATDFKPLKRKVVKGYIKSAKGRPDVVDKKVFAPLMRKYCEIYDFPKAWKFKTDPDSSGRKQKWFENWPRQSRSIRIDDWWEPQLKSTYIGNAWYEINWKAPQDWSKKKLILAFGAVDEQAWVWLNGKFIGAHADGIAGWNTPFEFDITGKVALGQENKLTVLVSNSAGVGGIWKSVKIFTDK